MTWQWCRVQEPFTIAADYMFSTTLWFLFFFSFFALAIDEVNVHMRVKKSPITKISRVDGTCGPDEHVH